MTEIEYHQVLRAVDLGTMEIRIHASGAKKVFLRTSPRSFMKATGCSVVLSCLITRAVVFCLDPLVVLISAFSGLAWIGLPGLLLGFPGLLLWGWTKAFFSTRLPSVFSMAITCAGISLIGPVYFQSEAATVYFVSLGVLLLQNFLLYAVPVSDVRKCISRSWVAFEFFHEASKNTLWPVITLLDLREYVDQATKEGIHRN